MDSGVLFVSPSFPDACLLANMLNEVPLPLVHVPGLREASRKLVGRNFHVILSEVDLEDGDWLDALNLAHSAGAKLVVTRPWADAAFWAEAINLGAYDLLVQPFQRTEVVRVLGNASGVKMAGGSKAVAVGCGV